MAQGRVLRMRMQSRYTFILAMNDEFGTQAVRHERGYMI